MSWWATTGAPYSSRTALKLAEQDLARSGLTLQQASADGIFPVDDASAVNPAFAAAPALIIAYRDRCGQPVMYSSEQVALPFCRARYLSPQGFKLPRGRRYDQPGDSGTPPFFPHSFDWQGTELDAVVAVEGEKKASALCHAGIPALAIGGVFNFTEGNAPLHSALVSIAQRCQDIYIVFDSDAATKPQIQIAEWRLAGQLALLGVRVHVVRIPPDGDEKVGADDYLVQHGGDALEKLILDTPALGSIVDVANDGEVSAADLLRHDVQPVEELIPGWIEKGIPNFIAGAGGVHKSRLALQWGLCLNAGTAVWGIGAKLEGLRTPLATLVYCAAEDDANELARRAQAICTVLKLKSPNQGIFLARRAKDSALVHMGESAQVEVRPFYHRLIARLQRIPGHKVLVLDSAYDFVRFMGRAKIDEDAVNYFIKVVLQGICDQADCTIVIPWHPSQAGSSRDSMDGWSVAWHNAARARLSLKEGETPDTYELQVVKRNHGPKGTPIILKYCFGALLPLDAVPDDGKVAALRQVVVKAAITAAKCRVPFNRRDSVPDLVFRAVESAIGRRPKKQEIRNALEEAVRSEELHYVQYTRHRAAGFYPPDTELAQDLANSVKRAAKGIGDA